MAFSSARYGRDVSSRAIGGGPAGDDTIDGGAREASLGAGEDPKLAGDVPSLGISGRDG